MSRSYKKFPVLKDRARTSKDCQKPKTYANHAVRRYIGIPGGKSGFKKLYCSWDICDYRFRPCNNEKDFRHLWQNGSKTIQIWFGDDYAKALNEWKKYYIRK